jgi:hypothetical protein
LLALVLLVEKVVLLGLGLILLRFAAEDGAKISPSRSTKEEEEEAARFLGASSTATCLKK